MKKIVGIIVLILLVIGIYYWYASAQSHFIESYSGPTEKVSLRLKWIHQAQFAGNYVAVEDGFYKRQGLIVDLQPINIEENTIEAVANGKVDFGIVAGDELIIARTKGLPVKAIMVIYKVNPVAIISLDSAKILSPADLVGKKVGIHKGDPIEYMFDILLGVSGVKQDRIKKVYTNLEGNDLLSGTVDAITGYVTNEPDTIAKAGKTPRTILLADYGINMYADVLITSDKMIAEKPELVQRFVRATITGWKYAINNVEDALNYTMKYAAADSRSHQKFMLENSIPLIDAGEYSLGEMDAIRWEQMQEILYNQKLLKSKITLSDIYTNKFVQEVNR